MTNANMSRTEAVEVYKNEALTYHQNRLQKSHKTLNPDSGGKALRCNSLRQEQRRED